MPTIYVSDNPSISYTFSPLKPLQQEVLKAYFATKNSETKYKKKTKAHTTLAGETLSKIAKKYKVKTAATQRTKTTKYLQVGEKVNVTILEPIGEKVTFKKIDNAIIGEEVYIIVETLHLEDETVLINILQGEEEVLAKMNEKVLIQQDGNDVGGQIRTQVSNYTKEDVINKDDFINLAIAKVKLEPINKDLQKQWKYNLECNSQNKAKLYLLIDVHSENSIPNFKSGYILYQGYKSGFDDSRIPNHFLNEDDAWFGVRDAVVEYTIYYNGKIERKTAKNAKKGKYIYIDAKNGRHDLGTYEFKNVKNNYGSNYGDKNVNLVDFRTINNYENGDIKFGISINTERFYMNQDTLASLFGAMLKCGYEDYTFNGFSDHLGRSVGGSKTHKNGYNGDLRYLRKDKTGTELVINSEKKDKEGVVTGGYKDLDEERQNKFNDALYDYGWKSMISQKYGKEKDKLLNHTTEDEKHYQHYNHLHVQGYDHKFIKEKKNK